MAENEDVTMTYGNRLLGNGRPILSSQMGNTQKQMGYGTTKTDAGMGIGLKRGDSEI